MSIHTMKNVLVTGGAGFIGANFIYYLQNHFPDVTIINLDLLTYAGNLQNLTKIPNPTKHHFVEGDINDADLVNQLFKKFHIDTVVHFAAESHVDRSIENPLAFITTNVNGTATLLEAAKLAWLTQKIIPVAQCRFHHISTDEVFGSLSPYDAAFTEESLYQPNSPYSASKAASDHLVRAYHHTFGLPVTLSHCSNNYGPLQHQEKFIPTVIRSCLNQSEIPIYGDGSNQRDWLHVEDHCAAIVKIICKSKTGESYNIGGNNEWGNLKLAELICHLFDKHYPKVTSRLELLRFVKDRPGHDWRYAINNDKIIRELGWQPKHEFAEGILQTIDFYVPHNI